MFIYAGTERMQVKNPYEVEVCVFTPGSVGPGRWRPQHSRVQGDDATDDAETNDCYVF